jgi:hypothetical protein
MFASSKIKKIFEDWDKNGDGLIDCNEFNAALSSLGSNVDANKLIKMMEEELGKGGMSDAYGADKKFSYKEFIDWLKLDAAKVVKFSTMIPIWAKLAGQDVVDSGNFRDGKYGVGRADPMDMTVDFSEEQDLLKALVNDFGFSNEDAKRSVSDMRSMNTKTKGNILITYKDFLKILKMNPAIDYVDDKDTCGQTVDQLVEGQTMSMAFVMGWSQDASDTQCMIKGW